MLNSKEILKGLKAMAQITRDDVENKRRLSGYAEDNPEFAKGYYNALKDAVQWIEHGEETRGRYIHVVFKGFKPDREWTVKVLAFYAEEQGIYDLITKEAPGTKVVIVSECMYEEARSVWNGWGSGRITKQEAQVLNDNKENRFFVAKIKLRENEE